MITNEKTCDDCLVEMFKRVGLKYPNPKFTQQDCWYQRKMWSQEEEDNFKKWMRSLLKKRYKWSTKKVEWEVGMFLLNWGWTTSKDVYEKTLRETKGKKGNKKINKRAQSA